MMRMLGPRLVGSLFLRLSITVRSFSLVRANPQTRYVHSINPFYPRSVTKPIGDTIVRFETSGDRLAEVYAWHCIDGQNHSQDEEGNYPLARLSAGEGFGCGPNGYTEMKLDIPEEILKLPRYDTDLYQLHLEEERERRQRLVDDHGVLQEAPEFFGDETGIIPLTTSLVEKRAKILEERKNVQREALWNGLQMYFGRNEHEFNHERINLFADLMQNIQELMFQNQVWRDMESLSTLPSPSKALSYTGQEGKDFLETNPVNNRYCGWLVDEQTQLSLVSYMSTGKLGRHLGKDLMHFDRYIEKREIESNPKNFAPNLASEEDYEGEAASLLLMQYFRLKNQDKKLIRNVNVRQVEGKKATNEGSGNDILSENRWLSLGQPNWTGGNSNSQKLIESLIESLIGDGFESSLVESTEYSYVTEFIFIISGRWPSFSSNVFVQNLLSLNKMLMEKYNTLALVRFVSMEEGDDAVLGELIAQSLSTNPNWIPMSISLESIDTVTMMVKDKLRSVFLSNRKNELDVDVDVDVDEFGGMNIENGGQSGDSDGDLSVYLEGMVKTVETALFIETRSKDSDRKSSADNRADFLSLGGVSSLCDTWKSVLLQLGEDSLPNFLQIGFVHYIPTQYRFKVRQTQKMKNFVSRFTNHNNVGVCPANRHSNLVIGESNKDCDSTEEVITEEKWSFSYPRPNFLPFGYTACGYVPHEKEWEMLKSIQNALLTGCSIGAMVDSKSTARSSLMDKYSLMVYSGAGTVFVRKGYVEEILKAKRNLDDFTIPEDEKIGVSPLGNLVRHASGSDSIPSLSIPYCYQKSGIRSDGIVWPLSYIREWTFSSDNAVEYETAIQNIRSNITLALDYVERRSRVLLEQDYVEKKDRRKNDVIDAGNYDVVDSYLEKIDIGTLFNVS